jgi:hypothetical protein
MTTSTTNGSFMPLNTTEAPDFKEIRRSGSTENLPQENLFVHARTAPLPPEKEWEEHDDSIASSPTPGSGAQGEESQRARRVTSCDVVASSREVDCAGESKAT